MNRQKYDTQAISITYLFDHIELFIYLLIPFINHLFIHWSNHPFTTFSSRFYQQFLHNNLAIIPHI